VCSPFRADNAQNLAIAGAAWIVMDYLSERQVEKFQKSSSPLSPLAA
jgi:hypothetical protein